MSVGQQPLVSVIMPAYNAEKYIAKSIESVLHQSYQNWELVIINDGSTDNTLAIIQKYLETDKRVVLIDNEYNKGLIYTRNKGLECAKGKYIANLDSDDIAFPHRLETQVKWMESNLQYVGMGSACEIIDSLGNKQGLIRRDIPNHHLKVLLLFSNYFINSSVLLRAELAKQTKYASDIDLSEDYQFFVRLSKRGKLGNINTPLVAYRVHKTNISKEKERELSAATSVIQQRQLESLGITPTSEEMKLHSALVDGLSPNLGFTLNQVEEWLYKVIEANQTQKLYSDELLKYYAAFFFRRACQESGFGLKSVRAFKKSPLSKFMKQDIKGNSIFFVRTILKRF